MPVVESVGDCARMAKGHIRGGMRRLSRVVLVACLALVSCSSTTTRQAPTIAPSGFLGDYSRLRPGGEGRALLVYRAPDADFARYAKVILDPVTVWRGPNPPPNVSQGDLQALADLLYGELRRHLQTYYVMVGAPGPDTLRIRAALSEATPSAVMDAISQVEPVTGTTGGAKDLATGTPAWVGAASAELQILDAATGKELYAAADRRVGEKTLTHATNPWADVAATFAVWADAVVHRLQAEGGTREPLSRSGQPRP